MISTSVRSILSATPFCSSAFGTVFSCLIPSIFKYSASFFEVYSPPLSAHSNLIFFYHCFSVPSYTPTQIVICTFSTIAFHFKNFWNALLLSSIIHTHTNCDLSPMNVMKYSVPASDTVSIFLHMSPYKILRSLSDSSLLVFGKGV